MGDVLLTGTTIALFSAILVPVAGCVSLLFKQVMAEKDRSYARLEIENTWLKGQVERLQATQGPILDAILDAVQDPGGRWRAR